MNTNVTHTLADFASSTRFADLPPEVVHDTKRLILDTVACSVGSHCTDAGKIVVGVGRARGGTPESTVLVTGEKTSASNAAYVNSALANLMDFDDSMVFAGGHLAQVSIFPALAFAEREGRSGSDWIAAAAVAFEVATRLGAARRRGNMFFDESNDPPRMELNKQAGQSWGCFGAATGAGRMLGFVTETMEHAFGLAGYAAPVPTIGRYAASRGGQLGDLAMSKYTMYGPIAEAGAMGALLAAAGFTGDRTLLDGDRGFGTIVGADGFHVDRLLNDLGKTWNVSETSFKPYPTGRDFQSVVTVFERLVREHDLTDDDIEKVECGLFDRMAESSGHAVVKNQIDAQMSMNYAMAMVVLGYAPGPEWQNPARFDDPRVERFAQKVEAYGWPHADEVINRDQRQGTWKGAFPAEVVITTKRGTFEGKTDWTKGDPWFPETRASDEDVARKFRDCAAGQLRTDRTERAIELLFDLENQATLDEVIHSLT